MQSSSLNTVADNWLHHVENALTLEHRKKLYLSAIDGRLTADVYARLDRGSRRTTGIFFSGKEWASVLAEKIPKGKWIRYIDPSAGTGDLLIEVAKRFRKKDTVNETLRRWSERLVAVDLEPEFLRILWLRLVSLAMVKHKEFRKPGLEVFLVPRGFRAADFLRTDIALVAGDCVITNPPYQRINHPGGINGGGSKSAAAFHLEKIARASPKGVAFVALVPDVLRCGRNYQKFRYFLSEIIPNLVIESYGKFSCGVDVDVAIFSGVVGKKAVIQTESSQSAGSAEKISDFYKVSVGAVVPHRDTEDGALRPYIAARSLQRWGVLKDAFRWAAYDSKDVSGPFVVIRRTSSPSDKKRAVATVIDVGRPVLVENHLLVVHPLNGGLSECLELIRSLEDPRTDDWLNKNMRCRHLTVGAIKEMPFHRYGG
ncbi:MAG: hypothetical protein ACJ8GV_01260 [Luteimonas sp.]